jgi:predicted hotdog family 3-hydroxylacyl-ACP dehydratase
VLCCHGYRYHSYLPHNGHNPTPETVLRVDDQIAVLGTASQRAAFVALLAPPAELEEASGGGNNSLPQPARRRGYEPL